MDSTVFRKCSIRMLHFLILVVNIADSLYKEEEAVEKDHLRLLLDRSLIYVSLFERQVRPMFDEFLYPRDY